MCRGLLSRGAIRSRCLQIERPTGFGSAQPVADARGRERALDVGAGLGEVRPALDVHRNDDGRWQGAGECDDFSCGERQVRRADLAHARRARKRNDDSRREAPGDFLDTLIPDRVPA